MIAAREAELGRNARDTLVVMTELGTLYCNLGQMKTGLPILEEACRGLAAFPRDDPDRLLAETRLANQFLGAGRLDRAEALLKEILAAHERKSGPDHPDTLRIVYGLGRVAQFRDRPEQAEKLYRQAIDGLARSVGADHVDVAVYKSGLARLLQGRKEYAKAADLFKEIADNYAGHRMMKGQAGARARWAECLRALNRASETIAPLEELLPRLQASLGPDHPDTRIVSDGLIASYAALGRHQDVLNLREETLARRRTKLGQDHPDTLLAARAVIASLMELKRADDALTRIDEALMQADRAAAAGKKLDVRLKPSLLLIRLRIFQGKKDVAGCQATAEMYEKLGRNDAASLYDAACVRAVIAGLLDDDPPAAKAEADKAMAWLTRAVAAGWRSRARTEADADLKALRDRADFQALLGKFAKAPLKPAVKR